MLCQLFFSGRLVVHVAISQLSFGQSQLGAAELSRRIPTIIKRQLSISSYTRFPPSRMASQDPACLPTNANSLIGLRVASIFIILVGSMSGALFPVLARRSKWLHVPKGVFESVPVFLLILHPHPDNPSRCQVC